MNKDNLRGFEPGYTTPDGVISFFPNKKDGPEAYYVRIRKDNFYIHDRTLGDLTNPEVPTEQMMQSLDTMCGRGIVKFILEKNKLTPEYLHIALLQLRIKSQEEELRSAVSLSLQHQGLR
ncbi:MAG: hypothetical protein Q8L29_01125 [archaeon]|nr:hypothetical protein [archaeon]